MPEETTKNENTGGNNTTTMAAAAVTGAATTQAAFALYAKMTGNAYSENDINRLNELKRLYEEEFQTSAPSSWNLNKDKKPTSIIKREEWAAHVQQMQQFKQLAGHYHYQSQLITEYVLTYLMKRSVRWFGKGSEGDLIELFMGDWLNFAINDLSALGFDDESVKKIKKRIDYIERVQKHESIFQFGTITRIKNKFDVIESIKRQLVSCVDKAEQESLRQCAREKFDICRADIEAILLSCLYTIYYARGTTVDYEPLELACFIKPDENFITVSAKEIYPSIKNTYTGDMLVEIASLVSLKAFGLPDQDGVLASRKYFNSRGELKSVVWDGLTLDLPPWVKSEKVNQHLRDIQALGGSIIRVANLKKLIEEAYDLTGKVGDLWAYGDKQGKLSLKALLFLLEKEMNLLKSHYDKLYKYHNDQRNEYNLKNKINPHEGVNPNFNKVDSQKKNIDKLYTSILNVSQSMQEQMEKFPEDAPKRIDDKKRSFYDSISQYLKQFYPEIHGQYRLLEKIGVLNEKILDKNKNWLDFDIQSMEKVDNQLKEVILVWPLQADSQYTKYQYLNKPQFKSYFEEKLTKDPLSVLPEFWRLGDQYTHWVKGYFIYNQNNFLEFQELASALQEQVKDPQTIGEVNLAASKLRAFEKKLRQRIEEERPKWRFKWGIWPIKTSGWPFNRDANTFAELLLKELDITISNIDEAVKIAQKKINQKQYEEQFKKKKEKIKKPFLSLTLLDKSILNVIKDPAQIEMAANKLSMLNQETQETNHDPLAPVTPADNDSTLDKKIKNADRIFESLKSKFLEWKNRKSNFQFLIKRDDAQNFSKDLLEFRDQLPKEILDSVINSWESFANLLNIELEYPDNPIDDESKNQMILTIKLISMLKTDASSNGRKIKLDEFILEAQGWYLRNDLSSAARGYMAVGLMGKNTNIINSNQSVENSPSM